MKSAAAVVLSAVLAIGCSGSAPATGENQADEGRIGGASAGARRAPSQAPDEAAAAQPSTPPAAAATSQPSAAAPPPSAVPEYREVTIPAGTELPLRLETPLASDAAAVEDAVRARMRRALVVDGVEVVPAGALVAGSVTEARASAKVKGRARVAFRFHTIELDDQSRGIRTAVISREAQGTKKQDAKKIGLGAAGGAIVGGILGGGKGAAVGSAVGAGAGTGVMLATKGEEVRLPAGTAVTTRLLEDLIVPVPVAR